MNSSELLALQLSNLLNCRPCGSSTVNVNLNSPTGPNGPVGSVGPAGPTGPVGPVAITKTFTIYLDYSSPNALSRIYLPPGFCNTYPLGLIFTANDTDVVFLGTTNITISNTTYAFPISLFATGYTAGNVWSPIQAGNLGGSGVSWENTSDYTLSLVRVDGGRIYGGGTPSSAPSGILAGWRGTLSIQYL